MHRTKLDWLIVALCVLFILILQWAGYFDRDVRGLHIFQSLIYVAVIVLSLKHNKWGYGIGISIAAAWNYVNARNGFVFDAGFREWASFLRTGRITNPVWWVAPVAWFDHVALIICLVWAYLRLPAKRISDLAILFGSFVITIGYFLIIIAIFFSQFLPRLQHTLFG
jgi:hypothetical protein